MEFTADELSTVLKRLRRAEGQIHFRKKGFHNGIEAEFVIGSSHSFNIFRASKMQPLPVFFREQRQGRQNQFVESARALAAAHHQNRRTI